MKASLQSEPGQTRSPMRQPLAVLFVEDSPLDAELLIRYLDHHGFSVKYKRVDTPEAFRAALAESWDVVLCDYFLPGFGALAALTIAREKKIDLPFIVVSGAAGEETAVEVMKAGAHDYILKDRLVRLVPAIERELREAAGRKERTLAIEKSRHLAAIVDSTSEAIISHDLAGSITTWNAGAVQLFGYSESEVVGKSISLIFPSHDGFEFNHTLDKLRSGVALDQLDVAGQRKDGTRVDVSLAVSVIKDPWGSVIGASSIAFNITERKQMEAERQKMIEQLNQTLSRIKTLNGLLPICSSCKKVRDDHGYWLKLETFVRDHSQAEFSHSICPECMEVLYPDYVKRRPTLPPRQTGLET